MAARAVRPRVWRNATLELENFAFEYVSGLARAARLSPLIHGLLDKIVDGYFDTSIILIAGALRTLVKGKDWR
jgi:hypothetical protein